MSVVKVGDIAEQIRGVTYSKIDATKQDGEGLVPILRANNISEAGLTFSDLVYVPEAYVRPHQYIRQGDVVIAASSGSLDVVGKAAELRVAFPGSFGAFCKVLRPVCDKVYPLYFAHFFKTREYRRIISTLAAGANINNLKNEHLDDLSVPLPPLDEQKRIAAILDKADALRRKRRQALALLDSLTQSIFLEMFGDPHPTWQSLELCDAVKRGTIVTYGIVQAGEEVENGVPYIRTGDIQNGRISLTGLRRTHPNIAAKFARSRVESNEIVMSIRATVGTTALVPVELDGANLTQGTARIAPGESVTPEYLLHYLRSKTVQEWIQSQVKGATFREITLSRLRELMVIIPPMKLQMAFSNAVAKLSSPIADAEASAMENDALFASLQHRAFTGQL